MGKISAQQWALAGLDATQGINNGISEIISGKQKRKAAELLAELDRQKALIEKMQKMSHATLLMTQPMQNYYDNKFDKIDRKIEYGKTVNSMINNSIDKGREALNSFGDEKSEDPTNAEQKALDEITEAKTDVSNKELEQKNLVALQQAAVVLQQNDLAKAEEAMNTRMALTMAANLQKAAEEAKKIQANGAPQAKDVATMPTNAVQEKVNAAQEGQITLQQNNFGINPQVMSILNTIDLSKINIPKLKQGGQVDKLSLAFSLIEQKRNGGSVFKLLTGGGFSFGNMFSGIGQSYMSGAYSGAMQGATGEEQKAMQDGTKGPGFKGFGTGIEGMGFDAGTIGLNFSNSIETTTEKGKYGNITKGMDTAYDGIQKAVSHLGPYGKAVSAAMGINKAAGKVVGKIGGGTDGMTKGDAVMGSAFFQMTPLGLLNGFAGKKSHELNDLSNQTNLMYGDSALSGFGGTMDGVNQTMQYSHKKYGLFSSRQRKKANKAIDKLNLQQQQIQDIAAASSDAFDIQNNMASTNEAATGFDLQGGYQQSAVHVGKLGMKFNYDFTGSTAKGRTGTNNYQYVEFAKKGTKIESLRDKTNTFEKFKKYLGERGSEDDYNLKAFYECKETFKDEDGDIVTPYEEWLKTESKEPGFGHMDGRFKRPWHITYEGKNGELWKQDPDDSAWVYTVPENHSDKNGKPYMFKDYLKYFSNPEGQRSRFIYKGHEYTGNGEPYTRLKEVVITPEFKDGGQMNVIPEGNLHARLHHMEDADNLTKKGIPVVDNNGNQQAEIELNEIIFNKETTTKLEELWRKYKDSEDDELAIEAGKILTCEIMTNTDDRTGLIDTI